VIATAEPSGGLAAFDQRLSETGRRRGSCSTPGAPRPGGCAHRSPARPRLGTSSSPWRTPRSLWLWLWTPRRPDVVRWRCSFSTVSCAAALRRRPPRGQAGPQCGWRGGSMPTGEWLDRLTEHPRSLGMGEAGARIAAVIGPLLGMLLESNALVAVGLLRWPLTTLGYVVDAYGVDFRISAHLDHRCVPTVGIRSARLLKMLPTARDTGWNPRPACLRTASGTAASAIGHRQQPRLGGPRSVGDAAWSCQRTGPVRRPEVRTRLT
jgi:hypothetical protein